MLKNIQHFLFGFGSILNIFGFASELKLSSGGFAEDRSKMKQDSKKIQDSFTKVAYGQSKSTSSR